MIKERAPGPQQPVALHRELAIRQRADSGATTTTTTTSTATTTTTTTTTPARRRLRRRRPSVAATHGARSLRNPDHPHKNK